MVTAVKTNQVSEYPKKESRSLYLPQLSLCHPCAREETLSLAALSWNSAQNLLSLELLPTEEEDARGRAGRHQETTYTCGLQAWPLLKVTAGA